MRLQLQVYRNGLPPAKVLWTWGKRRATSASSWAAARTTVAQLLEEVNETIPLEAAEWGLEDYVVEVNGFECLHFHEASEVLRDGDEVQIRPLSTTDLRARKLSGRHQISYDGKHLIDGIAFGRPYFRPSAGRPAISIPPRKRRRLAYDEEDAENISPITALQQFDNRNLLPDDFEDDAEGRDEDYRLEDELDENDADFEIYDDAQGWSDSGSSEVEEDSAKENTEEAGRELARLSPAAEEALHRAASAGLLPEHRRSARLRSGLFPTGYGTALGIMDEFGHAFPGRDDDSPASLSRQRPSFRKPSKAPYSYVESKTSTSNHDKTPDGSLSHRAKRQRTASTLRHSPQSTPGSGKSVRFEGIDVPASGGPAINGINGVAPDEDPDDESDDDFAPSGDLEQDDNEQDDSDTSSSEDSETSASSSLTSSSSSESESSDSESSSDGVPEATLKKKSDASSKPSSKSAASANASTSLARTPPGQGQNATKKRNERRRRTKRMSHLQRTGQLPEQATLQDFERWMVENGESEGPGRFERNSTFTSTGSKADFEAKRAELLALLASGGVEVADGSPGSDENKVTDGESARPEEHSSRPKLDVGSSKRLLYGSLGLRTPKTKDDEAKIRQKLASQSKNAPDKLMSDHTGPDDGTLIDALHPKEAVQPVTQGLGDAGRDAAWKQKILLSAVECLDENVELSVPPFPFVQRWDSQYQKPRNKGGRGKKRKRRASQQEDSLMQHAEGDFEDTAISYGDEDVQLNYDDPHLDTTIADQAPDMERPDGEEGAFEDLPLLPPDVSACPALIHSDLKPGQVIFYKQLDMDDNWQPEISEYRTATVDQILQDGTIQLTLAKRDRKRREAVYDERTGQKLYDRFEMPNDEADDATARGVVEITFSELIDPHLLDDKTADSAGPGADKGSYEGKASDEDQTREGEVSNESNGTSTQAPVEAEASTLEEDLSLPTGQAPQPENGTKATASPRNSASGGSLPGEAQDSIALEALDSPRFYGLDSSYLLDQPIDLEDSMPSPSKPPSSVRTPDRSSYREDPVTPGERKTTAMVGDGPSSDSEFPSMDALFSTARTSLESPNSKVKIRVSEEANSDLPPEKSPLTGTTGLNGTVDLPSDPGTRDTSEQQDTPKASQYIDLTFQSDTAAPIDGDSLLFINGSSQISDDAEKHESGGDEILGGNNPGVTTRLGLRRSRSKV